MTAGSVGALASFLGPARQESGGAKEEVRRENEAPREADGKGKPEETPAPETPETVAAAGSPTGAPPGDPWGGRGPSLDAVFALLLALLAAAALAWAVRGARRAGRAGRGRYPSSRR